MTRVLIVGNVTKDVYLRLDDRQNRFEVDDKEVAWLDLAFDGSSYSFRARHAVFGGAAVSLEVLSRFGLAAKVAGSKARFIDGELTGTAGEVPGAYRYILCQDDSIAYFNPSQVTVAKWAAPSPSADWIFIDCSAGVTRDLAENILEYLRAAENTKLAVFDSKQARIMSGEMHMHFLKERAELIFAEAEDDADCAAKRVWIGKDYVQHGDMRAYWSLQEKQNLMTYLTTDSIIAASVLGAAALGKTVEEGLLLATANVENANLDGALNLNRLEELVVGENYRVEKITKQEKQNGEL